MQKITSLLGSEWDSFASLITENQQLILFISNYSVYLQMMGMFIVDSMTEQLNNFSTYFSKKFYITKMSQVVL